MLEALMINVLSRSLLVAILLSIGYLPAFTQGGCVDNSDCAGPVVVTQDVVINIPWGVGGPGCFLWVNMTTRVCPARCEVFFNSIKRSDCCASQFNTTTAAALVAFVRDWLYANPQIAPCAVMRIVYPSCWTKDNVAGTMTACVDPPCCYIQGAVGAPPGPVTVLGAGACVLPCISVCP